MALPYESSTSGEKALGEIQKILRGLGCNKFGSMVDDHEQSVLVQFEYRGRQCSVKASMAGYASAYMKAHKPARYTNSTQDAARAKKARDIASVAVYSILRDWIKGQIMAIETGILSFDQAFMGQIMLPNGLTVHETLMKDKKLPPLLEGPKP